jgi:hypothetical protein
VKRGTLPLYFHIVKIMIDIRRDLIGLELTTGSFYDTVFIGSRYILTLSRVISCKRILDDF